MCGRLVCSGVYANNVECVFIKLSGHIVYFTEFICGIYCDMNFLIWAHVVIGICGMYMVFKG